MVSHEEMTRFRKAWPWWRCAVTGLSALALVLSSYLSWHFLAGGPVIGCGGGSSCDQVLSSRWSTVGGILPVSGLAAGAYLAMLIASLFIGPATETLVRRLAWSAMLVLAGAAAGSAVWFTIIQKWFIGAFCPYCMSTHITGVLLAGLIIWRALRQLDIGRLPAIGLTIAGIALAGILAVSQVVFVPTAVSRGGESQENQPAIEPRAVPLVGSPDANYIVNLLFDYKCSHCQQLHFLLDEAINRYNGKLAFVLCPSPLEKQCNPYVAQDREEFKDSCELAKVGLAVWLANREAFAAFENWMFSFESGDRWQPRSLDGARAKAVELVGQAKFDAARTDPWIDSYLRAATGIYGNTLAQGGNAIPKLVFGSRWVIPQPRDSEELVSILQDSLAVPKP